MSRQRPALKGGLVGLALGLIGSYLGLGEFVPEETCELIFNKQHHKAPPPLHHLEKDALGGEYFHYIFPEPLVEKN